MRDRARAWLLFVATQAFLWDLHYSSPTIHVTQPVVFKKYNGNERSAVGSPAVRL